MDIINQFLKEGGIDPPKGVTLKKLNHTICKKYWNNPKSVKRMIEILKNGCKGKILIDNSNDKRIGYIVVWINEHKHKEVVVIEIEKEYQRKGYAKILLSHYPRMQVLYTEADNKPAINLYKSIGWVDSGITGNFSKDKNHLWLLLYKPKYIKKEELKVYIGANLDNTLFP